MIFTVTPSPSLDLLMEMQQTPSLGKTLRAVKEELRPGGKGINISIMLKHLGKTSTALGFVAGFSGDELMRLTMAEGIQTGFIRVRRGRTRINLRLKAQGALACDEMRINGLGPTVTADDISYLVRKVSSLSQGDCLVLAGAVPPSLPQDIYATFFKALENKGVDVIVDAPPELLQAVLRYHPFLVKTNLTEWQNFLGRDLSKLDALVEAAQQLRQGGALNVLISMGASGAVFVPLNGQAMVINAPGGVATDRTGAGDSMVAGFIAQYASTHDVHSAALMAVAAGSATALGQGIASATEVQTLFEELKQTYALEA